MFKKIGLSAAAILAVVALAKPPAVMAADRDDSRYGDRDAGRRNVQESRDYRGRDYQERDVRARDVRERDYRDRDDQRRADWRYEGRDRDWR